MEGGGVDLKAKEPSHEMVAEWLINVYGTILEGIARNACKNRDFEWF